MCLLHSLHAACEVLTQIQCVLQQPLLLDDLDACQSRSAGHGIAAVTCGSGDRVYGVTILFRHHHGCDREAVAEALAQSHHIWRSVVVLHAEVFPRAPHAGEHLVCHEQDVSLITELAQLREEVFRRKHRSGPALHRFEYKSSHFAGRGTLDELVVESQIGVGVYAAILTRKQWPIWIRAGHHVEALAASGTRGRGHLAQADCMAGFAVEIHEA